MNTTTHDEDEPIASITYNGHRFAAHVRLDDNLNLIYFYTRVTPAGRAMALELLGHECWSIVQQSNLNIDLHTQITIQSKLQSSAAMSLQKIAMLANQDSPFNPKEYGPQHTNK